MEESGEKYAKAFGLAVRTARQRLEISQEQLADACNLHRTYIGSVERGERNITLQNIFAIAEALNTSASELIKCAEAILSIENRRGD